MPVPQESSPRRSKPVVEVAQYFLVVGSSDVTDLIVNTAGGLAGIGFITLARRGLRDSTAAIMTGVCLIVTVLAFLAAASFAASLLHNEAPRHTGTREQG